jgi:Phosphotransferase enzyme family
MRHDHQGALHGMADGAEHASAQALRIPSSWDAVTPAWMTSALSAALPGVEVSDVELVLRDDGTNRRARFGLSYSRGSGPATVFLKASDPEHAALNARTGGVFNEPRLFAAQVPLPVDHPRVYFTLIDEPRLDFIMVMEDIVARGGDPRDATRPMSIDQVANGVRGLARLHSAYWNDRLRAHPKLSWVEPFVAWKGIMARGIDIGLERAGDTIPPEVQHLTGAEIESELWARFIGTLGHGSQTLLHGDPHIGNTYVLPDDGVGFLDWQVLRRGNHCLDLGYFLQGALTVADRRSSEMDLVEGYREALDLPDEERPTREEIWCRYRASAAHGLAMWLVTAASDTWQRPEVSLTLAQRYAAACVDLESVAAIDELIG